MSSGMMETDPGGENSQYEGNLGMADEQKKSGGQLGDAETTTHSSATTEGKQRQAERGEQTAENIRYGQGISEGGMGGMTTNSDGQTSDEGYGRMADETGESNGKQTRAAAGYGGKQDMDNTIGG